ncbi:MAG: hypothetical protein JWR15_3445, partial [Prosthecobacter sp.]|nr:hypothetical protein [Prosthecobacter sp.]
QLPWCWGLLTVLVAFVLFAVARKRWAVLSIASVALLPLIACPFVQDTDRSYGTLLSWLATLHLTVIGITLIVLEFTGKKSAPRLGASLLSILIIARMADSHFSLLAKGVAFIGVGMAFLAFNILMSRQLKQKQAVTV